LSAQRRTAKRAANRIVEFFRGFEVIEVKSVQSQNLNSQIQDILARATGHGRQATGGRPILVRTKTLISGRSPPPSRPPAVASSGACTVELSTPTQRRPARPEW
jgi:hypothetical protein